MKVKNLVLLGIVSYLTMACTQTIIVYKPSKQIDPLPKVESEEDKDAKSKGLDPMNEDQWALHKVGISKDVLNKDENLKGNYNVKVAILSTGIDYNHKDLIGQVHVNKSEITQEGLADEKGYNQKDDDKNGLVDDIVGVDVVDNDGLAYDRHGAGTAVAGIIAAKTNNATGISGIMKEVTLYPVRYINDNGQTNLANLLNALDVVLKVKPDVVFVQQLQFQLGGRDKDPALIEAEISLMKKKLDKIKELKIPVIVGAGEDIESFGTSRLDQVIRSYDNVVVVTSTNESDNLSFLAKYSFTAVHTSAPGENVLTTQPLNQYGKVSGTAFAAAHVTAAVALAKAKYAEKLSMQDLVATLISEKGGDYIQSLDRYSRGGNRLNVVKFLTALAK
ncbi:MAG: S8 family serine peptidase [Bdellovibrionales bacterium]|nr:S8 family serine peptidase [Bdellovibrionales bacterium]